jgi:hypothetical protein
MCDKNFWHLTDYMMPHFRTLLTNQASKQATNQPTNQLHGEESFLTTNTFSDSQEFPAFHGT